MKKIISSLALIPIVLFTISINNSVAQWVPTSGPGGGRVNCFTVSGSNIFAGVFGRGVYRSTNSGMSWTAVNNGITDNALTCLSANGLNIFAGIDHGDGGGIFYSSNNGDNWVSRNNGLTNQKVWSFAVLGNYTFAGTAGGGIFRSANNGESWTAVNNGLTILSVYSFSVNGNNLFAGTEYGVYLSTNNGESWNAANNGLPNLSVLSFVLSGTNLFSVLYSGGVFLSSNNGESWTVANNGLPNLYVNTIASNGNDLFVGTLYSGIYYSNNNGGSWTAVNNGLTSPAINALAISGTNIFAGTDANGVFRSTNNGNNWTTVNSGLTCLYVDALTSNGTNIFASVWKDLGYYGSGVFKTSNNGDSWTELNNCFSYYQVQYLFSNETIMLAGTAGTEGGVFRSTDNGDSWYSTGLNSICSFLSCGNNVFAGTGAGIFLSSNNGDSWNYTGLTNLSVTALTSIGSNIFAGTNTGVFQSSNNGESWVPKGLSTKYINTLTASGNNLFAGTSDNVGYCGIYLSTNYGTSWTTVNNGLTSLYVRSIISIGTNIVAGTGAGIYLSTNNGTNWINKNQGFENLPYVGLWSNLLNANNYIFAGISDFSVWKREMIDGYLIVTSPNGGENYIPGTTQNITWNSFGVQNVKIELTTNNGGTWSTISPSYPAASGSYTWTVPNYNSANCKTRISDVLNSGINDISDNTFIVSIYSLNLGLIAYYPFESNADDMSGNGKHGTIMNHCEFVNGQVGNGIKVFGSPNYLGSDGGHVLLPNMEFINNYTQFTISLWVKYENLNDNDGEGYVFFGDHNSGFIGISNFYDSISFYSSNYDGFNIAASNDEKNIFVYYSLVYDNGTLKGYRNGQLLKTITCTYTPNIYGSFSGVGAHSWYGCNCAGSTRFTGIFDELRLYNRALTSSEIQQLFNQAPNVALTSPNGCEFLKAGAKKYITWEAGNVNQIKLEYTTNNGANWNFITTQQASNRSYEWTIPDVNSTQCKVKISNTSNPSVFDISDNVFSITPQTQNDTLLCFKVFDPTNSSKKVRLVCDGMTTEPKILNSNTVGFNGMDIDGRAVKKIELVDNNNSLIGHIEFKYTIDNIHENKRIDAALYVDPDLIAENAGYSIEWGWEYYSNPQEKLVSMLIPPFNRFDSIHYNKAPVLFVHGLTGTFPYWNENFLNSLTEYENWQFFYPYDQKIECSSSQLGKTIQDLLKANGPIGNGNYTVNTKVRIVAHSMGGLVARKHIQSTTYADNIYKLLMLATPNHGSYIAYRVKHEAIGHIGDIFTFDNDAPAYEELSPGSNFMFELNNITPRLIGNNDPVYKSYLVIAGTNDLLPYFKEIVNQEDGVVAVSSASLLNRNIPLTTLHYTHTNFPSGVSNELILNFLKDTYNPSDINNSEYIAVKNNVNGFWFSSTEPRVVDPDIDINKGIMCLKILGSTNNSDFYIMDINGNISTHLFSLSKIDTVYKILKKIHNTENYFSQFITDVNEIGINLGTGASKSFMLSRRYYTNKFRPFTASYNFNFRPLETTMKTIILSNSELMTLNCAIWLKEYSKILTKYNKTTTINKQYYIDSSLDSMVFYLTADLNDSNFSNNNFK